MILYGKVCVIDGVGVEVLFNFFECLNGIEIFFWNYVIFGDFFLCCSEFLFYFRGLLVCSFD